MGCDSAWGCCLGDIRGKSYRSPPRHSSHHAAPGDELDNQHHDRDHQQEVDQAARNVETETQYPQNEKNHEDRPEHAHSFENTFLRCRIATPAYPWMQIWMEM